MTAVPEPSDTPYCAEGCGNPATQERYTDVVPVAVDDDGFCWVAELICPECVP